MTLIRRYAFLSVLSLSTALGSCNKWLDVKPESQVDESDLFSNEQGFADAMTGVYTQAADQSLYGSMLTSSFLEVLAQRYTNVRTNTFHNFYDDALYTYSDAATKARIESIWGNMYGAIAETNFLLRKIDGAKSVFATEKKYRQYKGQALGMRAFLHFDIVRMFAPSYLAGKDERYIPYMTLFTVTPQASVSTASVLDSCISDLKKADELLSDIPKGDGFWFDQWAVKAELARIYLYKGDKTNALVYAKQVIESRQYRFITAAEVNATNPDRVFTPEVIFSLSVFGLKTISDTYFSETANGATIPNYVYLQVNDATLKANYDFSTPNYGSDPRYKLWWQLRTGATTVFFSKYWTENNLLNRVPLITLPEMYYIAAESEPDLATAKAYIDTVHIRGRFIPAIQASDATMLTNEITKEYIKEFYGAGQLFFYYKRRNVTVPGATATGNALFVFPTPTAELEFRF